MMQLVEIPLFPLNTVLFPGGRLPLRIFEPRYLSMIGECMRAGKGFGVMLIRDGGEAGAAADFYAVGTVAQIIDFDQLDDGMLGITCQGGQLVRTQSHQVRPDQLIVGEVELLAAEPVQQVPAEHKPLQTFLQQLLQREEAQAYRQGLQEDWDNAEWLGCRLAELLPLTSSSRQILLESDALQRLSILHELMQENQLLA